MPATEEVILPGFSSSHGNMSINDGGEGGAFKRGGYNKHTSGR
jgi:hypothetical protein